MTANNMAEVAVVFSGFIFAFSMILATVAGVHYYDDKKESAVFIAKLTCAFMVSGFILLLFAYSAITHQ